MPSGNGEMYSRESYAFFIQSKTKEEDRKEHHSLKVTAPMVPLYCCPFPFPLAVHQFLLSLPLVLLEYGKTAVIASEASYK